MDDDMKAILEKIQDMLDDLELRVDAKQGAYPKEEYIRSGIRSISHEMFQAQKLVV